VNERQLRSGGFDTAALIVEYLKNLPAKGSPKMTEEYEQHRADFRKLLQCMACLRYHRLQYFVFHFCHTLIVHSSMTSHGLFLNCIMISRMWWSGILLFILLLLQLLFYATAKVPSSLKRRLRGTATDIPGPLDCSDWLDHFVVVAGSFIGK
jgi:hypothetical protein